MFKQVKILTKESNLEQNDFIDTLKENY